MLQSLTQQFTHGPEPFEPYHGPLSPCEANLANGAHSSFQTKPSIGSIRKLSSINRSTSAIGCKPTICPSLSRIPRRMKNPLGRGSIESRLAPSFSRTSVQQAMVSRCQGSVRKTLSFYPCPPGSSTVSHPVSIAHRMAREFFGSSVGFVKRPSSPPKQPPPHRPQQSLGKRRQANGLRNVPCVRGAARGSHARWWVARSMGSLWRNDEVGLAGDGGLINDLPTAPPHPTPHGRQKHPKRK